MFSLIITIVSIALVVALVAATIYYGADTLTRGQAAANAAGIVSGGEQMVAALQTHYAITGSYPLTLDALRTGGYLTSFPKLADAGFALISSAHAAPVDGVGDWLYDHANPHLVYVGTLDMETCAEVNSQVNGHRVVLNRIDPDPRAQCVVKGAQTPVVVFRHPGDKDFAGWDDHPRIPSPQPGGGFKAPDYAGACVFGCAGEQEGAPGPTGNASEYLSVWRGIVGGEREYYSDSGEELIAYLPAEPAVPAGCLDYGSDAFWTSYSSSNGGDWRTLSCSGWTVANTSEHTIQGISLDVASSTNNPYVGVELIADTCTNATLAPGETCYYTIRVVGLDNEGNSISLTEEAIYNLSSHLSSLAAQGLDGFEPYPATTLIRRWPN